MRAERVSKQSVRRIIGLALVGVLLPLSGCLHYDGILSHEIYFSISIDPTAHTDYGLSYPITYEFNISSGAASVSVYQKKTLKGKWTKMTEKTASDFFNGVEAARFDYVNNKGYISIAFGSASDNIYLLFKDSNGATYSGITDYYDNRRAAVVFSCDDWRGNQPSFTTCIDNGQSRKIWVSVGIITGNITSSGWQDIQSEINQGYVEPVAHSRTHPQPPYADPDSEIGGSKRDLVDNLDLPDLWRSGSTEYIYAWFEPYGHSDSITRSKLGAYKYLADRDSYSNNDVYATWDNDNGLYNRIGYSIRMGSDGTTSLTALNDKFDSVYDAGGIYHLMCHPPMVDWSVDQYAQAHLNHIMERRDVWYIGFGHLYLYHYTKNHIVVTKLENYSPPN